MTMNKKIPQKYEVAIKRLAELNPDFLYEFAALLEEFRFELKLLIERMGWSEERLDQNDR